MEVLNFDEVEKVAERNGLKQGFLYLLAIVLADHHCSIQILWIPKTCTITGGGCYNLLKLTLQQYIFNRLRCVARFREHHTVAE